MTTEELIKKKEYDIANFLANDSPEEALKIVNIVMDDEKIKWRKKMQRIIMNYYFEKENIEGIKKIIAATVNRLSQKGRIKKLETNFPKVKYTGPLAAKSMIKEPKTYSDFVKNEITKGDLKKAHVFIEKIQLLNKRY